MDHLLKMMDDYTNNLESLVDERTAETEAAKKQADNLLLQLLPR